MSNSNLFYITVRGVLTKAINESAFYSDLDILCDSSYTAVITINGV